MKFYMRTENCLQVSSVSNKNDSIYLPCSKVHIWGNDWTQSLSLEEIQEKGKGEALSSEKSQVVIRSRRQNRYSVK